MKPFRLQDNLNKVHLNKKDKDVTYLEDLGNTKRRIVNG